ncbi:MAG: hypothetical protein QOF60_553 [Actinomycetota bacterium]|nr:hypothetical protein [Actinomycetota bacterium]
MTAAVAALAVITIAIKGAGSLLERIPDEVARRLAGLAPALLAALVYVELADNDNGLPHADAKAAGVGAAVVLAAVKAPFAICVIGGAVVAAGLRAAGVS